MSFRLADRFELMLAARMLRGRRSTQLSVVAAMSTAGIALGVAALIVVLAVNTGFQAAFQDRILSTYPHLVVMRQGLDLDEWRRVQRQLARLPFVRSAVPATYDDMMLSSQGGRAGAVVRGVPAASLAGLPEGLILQGAVDLHGEAPRLAFMADGALDVVSATAGGRHVVWVGAGADDRALQVSPLLPPQTGFAGLLVFDAGGCRKSDPAGPPAGEIRLDRGERGDVQRHVERRPCAIAAWWEVLDGDVELVWQAGGVARRQALQLHEGQTLAVAIQGDIAVVVPASADVPPTAAGVLVANLGTLPLAIRVGGRAPSAGSKADAASNSARPLPPGERSGWLSMAGELPAIALGEGLAERLGAKLHDEVRAVSPLRAGGDGGRTVRGVDGRFRVTAIVRTGFYDHDQRLALVDFGAAQRFLGRGDVARWIDVRVDDPLLAKEQIPALRAAIDPRDLADLLGDARDARERLQRIQREVTPGLELQAEPATARAQVDNWLAGVRALRQVRRPVGGMYRVIDWEEMNRNIFDAARMQKVAMSLFPFIIVLVAALNVIGTQAVVVHERARDIAILRAMGARRRSIGAIFLIQGMAVGLIGTALGLLVGGLCCVLLDQIGYPLDPHVYLISRLPVLIEPQPFLLAGTAAVALCFGAAWVAARRASERSPVDGLRRLD